MESFSACRKRTQLPNNGLVAPENWVQYSLLLEAPACAHLSRCFSWVSASVIGLGLNPSGPGQVEQR